MGRGKMEIKKIENPTNRQVTLSKRRVGLFKKAEEISVLCDAEVLVVIASSNNKVFNYCTPGTDTKSMVERYQECTGVDLWESTYRELQKQLAEQLKIKNDVCKEIRQRKGKDLDDLSLMELHMLTQDLCETANIVREKKMKKLEVQANTRNKKVRSLRESKRNLEAQLHYMEMQNYNSCNYVGQESTDAINQYNVAYSLRRCTGDVYDTAAVGMEEYDEAAAVGLTSPNVGLGHGSLAFSLQPNQPNLHAHMDFDISDLRLAP